VSAPAKGDITDCFRCGGTGKVHRGQCTHCAGTGKLKWIDYGHSEPFRSEGQTIRDAEGVPLPCIDVIAPYAVTAKLCAEDEERLDRIEAMLAKLLAEKGLDQ
jgi:hypothetical protein